MKQKILLFMVLTFSIEGTDRTDQEPPPMCKTNNELKTILL